MYTHSIECLGVSVLTRVGCGSVPGLPAVSSWFLGELLQTAAFCSADDSITLGCVQFGLFSCDELDRSEPAGSQITK